MFVHTGIGNMQMACALGKNFNPQQPEEALTLSAQVPTPSLLAPRRIRESGQRKAPAPSPPGARRDLRDERISRPSPLTPLCKLALTAVANLTASITVSLRETARVLT